MSQARYPHKSVDGRPVRASKLVWQQFFGLPVPKRIYHRDGNPANIDPANLTDKRSDCVNDAIRSVCETIRRTYCVKVDNRIVNKTSGMTVYPKYDRLERMGLITGHNPVVVILPEPEYSHVMLRVHVDIVDDVLKVVQSMHKARGLPYDHH